VQTGSNLQTFPSWNISGRPAKAKPGMLGFNLQTGSLEYWNGSSWLILPMTKLSEVVDE
jgi:hypothetical protein